MKTSTAEPTNGTATTVKLVSPFKIAPSLSNPRKHFDQVKLQELAQSVKAHGVVQPLVVRPTTTWHLDPGRRGKTPIWNVLDERRLDRAKQAYAGEYETFESEKEARAHLPEFELVCGERRWRAAKLAALAEVPCLVRELTDKAVLEIQVIENLQREDVHPIEEAEGYETLMQKHGYTVEDLVAKVGKSREYIYARKKLLALCEAARKAFYEGKLTPSTALLVARIPHEDLQKKALKSLEDDNGEPRSFRDAARIVQDQYMLRLKEAPFDIKDGTLPGGPCAACPKRTGNQKELFADVTGADVCTDPKCFAGKKDASQKRQLQAVEKEGITTLDKEEAANVFKYSWHSKGINPQSRFTDLTETCPEDTKKRTYAKLVKDLGPKAPKVFAAIDTKGEVRRLVEKSAFANLFKAAGEKIAGDSPTAKRDQARLDSQRYAEEEELRELEADTIMAAIVAKLEALAFPLPVEFWRALVNGVDESFIDADEARRRRGEYYLPHLAGKLKTPSQVAALLAEICIDDDEDSCSTVAKALKVDTKAIAKKVKADWEAKKAAAAAAKPAPKKPAKKK